MFKKLLVIFIAVGFLAAGCNKTHSADNQNTPNPSPSLEDILHETYSNNKYGYSFKFPSEYKIETLISTEAGYDLPSTPVTPDSNPVVVSDKEGTSYMVISAFKITQPLSEENIKDDYATEPKIVSKIKIADTPGFKVTFSGDSKIPHDIYYLQKSNDSGFEIKIRKNEMLSVQMLNSFRFTK